MTSAGLIDGHPTVAPSTVAEGRAPDHAIVHSIPDPLRRRVPLLRNDAAYAKRVQAVADATPSVQSARINRAAASLIVGSAPGNEPLDVAPAPQREALQRVKLTFRRIRAVSSLKGSCPVRPRPCAGRRGRILLGVVGLDLMLKALWAEAA